MSESKRSTVLSYYDSQSIREMEAMSEASRRKWLEVL